MNYLYYPKKVLPLSTSAFQSMLVVTFQFLRSAFRLVYKRSNVITLNVILSNYLLLTPCPQIKRLHDHF